MALNSLRLRRALSLSSSLLHQHFHSPKLISPLPSISSPSPSPENPRTTPFFSELQSFRHFRSSPISFSSRNRRFESDGDMEITPDTILFEGCDYNHWLITVDFPKDNNLSAEEKVQKYVEIAAGVFGSEEEAKKKIYACSTTTYEGFQVECSEETSEKFKENPAVVFVLPDSYIDPVNKEYGGDKYINGTIIPRPPPIMSVRRNPRQNRGPGEARNLGPRQNFGPQQNYQTQQNFGPPRGPVPQQNYGPPQNTPSQQAQGHQQNPGWPQNTPSQHTYGHEQNHSPPQNTPFQQSYGHQQNHGPAQNTPSQQTYGYQQNYNSPRNIPSQQTYGQHQNYGLPQHTPPQQTYGHQQNAPPQHNYGMPENAAAQQNYGYHPPQRNYGQSQNHPNQQNYGPPQNFTPQQSFGSPGVHSPTQQNYGQPGEIEGRGPTNAPIGGDQYHGGRGDFPQGNQMYTPSQGRSFHDHPGGAPGQEMGPAYGENNQRHGENQKISEVDQSSRFQGGEQRNFG